MATSGEADREYLLYTLPALAVITPFIAFACLALGIGPGALLLRVCMIFLIVSPATGLLGLRTLSRVGSAASPAAHRTARVWCILAFATPLVLYVGLHWLVASSGGAR